MLPIVLFHLLAVVMLAGQTLAPGMTRHQVEQAMGGQGNYLERGNRGILVYPNGVKLTFTDGRLVAAEGVSLGSPLADISPKVSTEAEPEGVAPAGSPGEAAEPDGGLDTRDYDSGLEYTGDILTEEFGKEAVALATTGVATPETEDDAAMEDEEPGPLGAMEAVRLSWYLEFGLVFVMATVAFKIACKFAGVEALWGEIMGVAIIDALASVGVSYIKHIPEWGVVFSAAKLPYILPMLVMAAVVPLMTPAKSFPSVISVTLGTQFAKFIMYLIALNVVLAAM